MRHIILAVILSVVALIGLHAQDLVRPGGGSGGGGGEGIPDSWSWNAGTNTLTWPDATTVSTATTYGDELVTNGDFNGNADGWDLGGWTYNDGGIRPGAGHASQEIELEPGQLYHVTIDVEDYVEGTLIVAFGNFEEEFRGYTAGYTIESGGTHEYDVVASVGSTEIDLTEAGFNAKVSRVSVKLATPPAFDSPNLSMNVGHLLVYDNNPDNHDDSPLQVIGGRHASMELRTTEFQSWAGVIFSMANAEGEGGEPARAGWFLEQSFGCCSLGLQDLTNGDYPVLFFVGNECCRTEFGGDIWVNGYAGWYAHATLVADANDDETNWGEWYIDVRNGDDVVDRNFRLSFASMDENDEIVTEFDALIISESDGAVAFPQLAGEGQAYACISQDGVLERSDTPCGS